jgi:hypothetical protein
MAMSDSQSPDWLGPWPAGLGGPATAAAPTVAPGFDRSRVGDAWEAEQVDPLSGARQPTPHEVQTLRSRTRAPR